MGRQLDLTDHRPAQQAEDLAHLLAGGVPEEEARSRVGLTRETEEKRKARRGHRA